jgi:glycosyltransferase involved in cell wall biosynthesis
MSVDRVVWVLVHPTPYNIYLLNELSRRTSVPLSAVYQWATLGSHPWTDLPERRFPWRILKTDGPGDAELRAMAGRSDTTLLIFNGWRDRSIAPLVIRRWTGRLPFAFWMDTPKLTRNPLRLAMNRLLVLAGGRAAAMLATGRPAMDAFIQMGFPAERVLDFPFLVDPQHFGAAVTQRAARNAARVVGAGVRFIQCGRLIDSLKGQSVAMKALAIAHGEAPDLRLELWISGSGADEDMLRQKAAQLGVAEQVRFLGWTGYEELPALFGEADALVMPSHWDPFPVTVIEAMAAGLPVLGSTACGSVRERVQPGATGWIHEAGDASALARHMLNVARHPEQRLAMGAAAAAASRQWGIDRSIQAYESLLRRAAG